jgi:restriction system protein
MQHWKTQKLDVRVVREMYGVMTAEGASGAIIITSGLFTQDARNFAEDKPIDLVEGYQLADLIMSVQKPSPRAQNLEQSKPSKMTCQKCGSSLVIRVARRGKTPGRKFWGCSNFPKCTFTQNTRRDRFNSQWPSIPTPWNSKIKDLTLSIRVGHL